MDLLAVGFWDEHDREFLALFGESRIDAELDVNVLRQITS